MPRHNNLTSILQLMILLFMVYGIIKIWSDKSLSEEKKILLNERKKLFKTDPFLGCPFDDKEMIIVEEYDGLKMKEKVKFQTLGKMGPIFEGEIIAVGALAKYCEVVGYFTAFIIKVGEEVYLCKTKDILKN